jgi:flavodoxin I
MLIQERKGFGLKTLVVFDSVHGNTEQIARSIATAVGGKVEVARVSAADVGTLKAGDLLVIGSPTNGGRPTPAIQAFIERIPKTVIETLGVAAFDTRLSMKLVRVFGYAAEKIAEKLKERGATMKAPPAGFFVKGRNGPLVDGETERAAAWAQGMQGAPAARS